MTVTHVTDADLAALLGGPGGTGAFDPARVTAAVDAANYLIDAWAPVAAGAPERTETTPALAEAGRELAHLLYRAQGAPGGFTDDDVLARLPADRVRGIRDLLDADTGSWGLA